MRFNQIALASIFSAMLALPALAQTPAPAATAPATTAPATIAPAKPAAPAVLAPAHAVAKPAAASKVMAPVNVNTATAAELDALPGIGKARTASIIKNRPYKSVEEVDTKKAVPHAVFLKIQSMLTI